MGKAQLEQSMVGVDHLLGDPGPVSLGPWSGRTGADHGWHGSWGQRGETLPVDHPAWEIEAHYLAMGLVNFICTLSPQRIIMGGGVMEQAHLFPLIRQKVQAALNGYVQSPVILEHIDQYIVPPGLGNRAGVLGAIALAEQQLTKQSQ